VSALLAMMALGLAQPSGGAHVEPIERIAPAYPGLAERFGVEARCTMRFDVAESGQPQNICGACATTAPAEGGTADQIARLFVDAAVVSVGRWRYSPADSPAEDVGSHFVFILNGDPAALPPFPEPTRCEGPLVG